MIPSLQNLRNYDKPKYPKDRIPIALYKKYVDAAIKQVMGKEKFEKTDYFKVVANYFFGSEIFDEEYNLVKNTASLDKGLYIYGDVGTGKTLTMKIMHEVAKLLIKHHGNSTMWFSSRIAPYFPKNYMEAANDKTGLHNFKIESYHFGRLFIDDLGMEHDAFGNFDTVGEILFHRHRNEVKTFITSNLSEEDFLKRYGVRLADRLLEAYNIIEIKGTSKRKV